MKIIACVKQVPATETKIKIAASGTDIERSNLNYVVNPYCEFGVEEALRIKERLGGGEVTVLSLGPARVAEALRTCLAMGADNAIHILDETIDGADPLRTAMILASALKSFTFDLLFFGKQAVDDDHGAVGIQVAELLDLPHVAVVNLITIDPDARRALAHRQVEGGIEVFETSLPAVFTCQKGLNEPRYASLPGIMKAKQKPFKQLDVKSLELDSGASDPSAGRQTLIKLIPPPSRSSGKILEGPPAETVKELVRLLREEAKIL